MKGRKMPYTLSEDEKPMSGVDVYVVTETGVKGIAKFWDLTGRWLTQDKNLKAGDRVIKWKYADAT